LTATGGNRRFLYGTAGFIGDRQPYQQRLLRDRQKTSVLRASAENSLMEQRLYRALAETACLTGIGGNRLTEQCSRAIGGNQCFTGTVFLYGQSAWKQCSDLRIGGNSPYEQWFHGHWRE
jgi:hypothetical protein